MSLQDLAKRHLWMHFTRMGAYEHGEEIEEVLRPVLSEAWERIVQRRLPTALGS